jgi:hypothetical protein
MDYYWVRVYHSIPNSPSLALSSLIVVAIVVELVRFFHILSAHTNVLFSRCVPKQGEIIARLTVHTTLRGESKMVLKAAASLMA